MPGTLARDEDVLHVMSGGLDKVDLHSAGGKIADKGDSIAIGKSRCSALPPKARPQVLKVWLPMDWSRARLPVVLSREMSR